MKFNDKFLGTNLLITHDKTGQSYTLFSEQRFVRACWRCRIQRTLLFHTLVRSGYNHRWCGL